LRPEKACRVCRATSMASGRLFQAGRQNCNKTAVEVRLPCARGWRERRPSAITLPTVPIEREVMGYPQMGAEMGDAMAEADAFPDWPA
jgi:hypothetical protein